MEPTSGILPALLPLALLDRISPSRFTSLSKCALREVWTSSKQSPLLPPSPAARLGTAIHLLLEKAGRGEFAQEDQLKIEREWQELVNRVEVNMLASWLERSLTPLRNAVPDHEVRRLRAIRKAVEISKKTRPKSRNTEESGSAQFELWISSAGGHIGGFIDYVINTSQGTIIGDYKSGYIIDKNQESDNLEVKEEYKVQLKLYAAMYKSQRGHWPMRLEIVPLEGDTIIIPFSPQECEDLLTDAVASLDRINNKIADILTSPDLSEEILASPTPSNCRFCLYRPTCTAYQKASDNSSDKSQWPRDVWGIVEGKRMLGNGRLSLSLNVTNRPYPNVRIRGITPDPNRHPALQVIQEGDQIAVYNLRGSSAANVYSETLPTVIYKIPARR